MTIERRDILRWGTGLAGAAAVTGLVPWAVRTAFAGAGLGQLQGAAPQMSDADRINAMRTQMAMAPVETKKLRDNLYVIYNGGGNVAVLTGAEGKLIVDTSVAPNSPKILAALAAIDKAPLLVAIDTHWHFDHTDGNGPMHDAGATLVAHENTRKRMSETQDIKGFNLHFPPSPKNAWPMTTFDEKMTLYLDGESIHCGYILPAHTDSDIYVHFEKANVLHCGDCYFNHRYPFIDGSTGGRVDGMIAAADKLIALAGADTVIIPGHGKVSDKGALIEYRDMLTTVRDRVKAQKAAGKPLEAVIASKPTADFDQSWGTENVPADLFVTVVYATL
jgi:cyclase